MSSVTGFVLRRTWVFWVCLATGVVITGVGFAFYPDDHAAHVVAKRLEDVPPTSVDRVYWRVADGSLAGVAVVVPGADGTDHTVDLYGVSGDDVELNEGWQPAPTSGFDDPAYQAPLLVRFDLNGLAVAMADVDESHNLSIGDEALDVGLAFVGLGIVLATVFGTMAYDRTHAPPLRRGRRARR